MHYYSDAYQYWKCLFFFILHIFMEKFQMFEFQITEWFHFWILSCMDNNICSEISPIILYTEFLPLKYFQSEFFQITTMIWFFHVESSIKNFFLNISTYLPVRVQPYLLLSLFLLENRVENISWGVKI